MNIAEKLVENEIANVRHQLTLLLCRLRRDWLEMLFNSEIPKSIGPDVLSLSIKEEQLKDFVEQCILEKLSQLVSTVEDVELGERLKTIEERLGPDYKNVDSIELRIATLEAKALGGPQPVAHNLSIRQVTSMLLNLYQKLQDHETITFAQLVDHLKEEADATDF